MPKRSIQTGSGRRNCSLLIAMISAAIATIALIRYPYIVVDRYRHHRL